MVCFLCSHPLCVPLVDSSGRWMCAHFCHCYCPLDQASTPQTGPLLGCFFRQGAKDSASVMQWDLEHAGVKCH